MRARRGSQHTTQDWFLRHPSGDMMKTLSDKAVTNQSHCERWRTVKDISRQLSPALVRRSRPVTADSHAAQFCLQTHRKAFCSRLIPRHPITVSNFPTSLSLPLAFCHVFVTVCLGCGGQTEGRRLLWSKRTARWVLRRFLEWRQSHSGLSPSQRRRKHTHPLTIVPLLPAFTNICQQWHFLTPAQIFSAPSIFTCCSFHLVLLLTLVFNLVSILPLAALFSVRTPLTHTRPLLTSPGLTIIWESAKSQAGNGTCHHYCEATHTHTDRITLKQKPVPLDLHPLSLCLHAYHLAPVLLNYGSAPVSASLQM